MYPYDDVEVRKLPRWLRAMVITVLASGCWFMLWLAWVLYPQLKAIPVLGGLLP